MFPVLRSSQLCNESIPTASVNSPLFSYLFYSSYLIRNEAWALHTVHVKVNTTFSAERCCIWVTKLGTQSWHEDLLLNVTEACSTYQEILNIRHIHFSLGSSWKTASYSDIGTWLSSALQELLLFLSSISIFAFYYGLKYLIFAVAFSKSSNGSFIDWWYGGSCNHRWTFFLLIFFFPPHK